MSCSASTAFPKQTGGWNQFVWPVGCQLNQIENQTQKRNQMMMVPFLPAFNTMHTWTILLPLWYSQQPDGLSGLYGALPAARTLLHYVHAD